MDSLPDPSPKWDRMFVRPRDRERGELGTHGHTRLHESVPSKRCRLGGRPSRSALVGTERKNSSPMSDFSLSLSGPPPLLVGG